MLKEARESSGIVDLMKSSGALLTGHFELSSGLHSDRYIQCALLLQNSARAEQVGRELAHLLTKEISTIEAKVAVSPAVGGIIIGHEVARALGIRFVFTERVGGRMTLRRGFAIEKGEGAVVIEDVVTTGDSTRQVMEVISAQEGRVLAVGSIVNRGTDLEFGVPFVYLLKAEIDNYARAACPLCERGVELTKPGSRDPQTEEV